MQRLRQPESRTGNGRFGCRADSCEVMGEGGGDGEPPGDRRTIAGLLGVILSRA